MIIYLFFFFCRLLIYNFSGIQRPVRIGVFGSTRGTSLQPLIDLIESKKLNATISIVISNKSDAFILQRAKQHQIKNTYIRAVKDTSRSEYDSLCSHVLEQEGVDVVLLIGYMRILSSEFVQKWENKCLNVHPSLLPDFAGGMDLQVTYSIEYQFI